jgi:hypothetical protein
MMGTSREELFNRYIELSYNVRNLGSVVQNEGDITREDIRIWIEQANNTYNELTLLQSKTMKYFRGIK